MVEKPPDRIVAVVNVGAKPDAPTLDDEVVGDGDEGLKMLPLVAVLDLQLNRADEVSGEAADEDSVAQFQRERDHKTGPVLCGMD